MTLALLGGGQGGLPVNQRGLASTSRASVGTVNRVLHALREGTPSMPDASNRLLRPSALEDAWVAAYASMQVRAWPEERFSSDVWTDPSDLLDADLLPGAVLGSELATVRLGAPLRPAETLIHLPVDAHGRRDLIRKGRLRRDDTGFLRIRPAVWAHPPSGTEGIAPRPQLKADLLLENDPRIDEIRTELFGEKR